MNDKIKTVYVPIGVPTFHLETAERFFRASKELLKGLGEDIICPDEMLLSTELLKGFLADQKPDVIILQNITFANASYAAEINLAFPEADIILWALREPEGCGERLKLNSLTGVFSASNVLHNLGRTCVPCVIGNPEDKETGRKLSVLLKASSVVKSLKGAKIATVGHTPQGFGFGQALDVELQKNFGAKLVSIEARELIENARQYNENDVSEYMTDAENRMSGLSKIPQNNRWDFARLYRAYDRFVKDNGISALASRCWPDFFTDFGTPVCAVLGILNDMGIPAACETDIYGALSMFIGCLAGEGPAFFGDPVAFNEKDNTITFWHCGMAPCSLARKGNAFTSVHCNRKIGPTLEFGCRESESAVIFRIGRTPDGSFRFFIAQGSAVDAEKQFHGTSTVIKTKTAASDIIAFGIDKGWEPHYAVIYTDCADVLEKVGELLGIPVFRL